MTAPKEKTCRQVSKPQMERRRRARINGSLSELRELLLRSHTVKSCGRSKMEKADILELTVRYLKALTPASGSSDSEMSASRFCAGYADCANEANRFLRASDWVNDAVRAALLHRLSDQTAALAYGAMPPQFTRFSYCPPYVHTFALSDADLPLLDAHSLLPLKHLPSGQSLSPKVVDYTSQPLQLPLFERGESWQAVSDGYRWRQAVNPSRKIPSVVTSVWRPW